MLKEVLWCLAALAFSTSEAGKFKVVKQWKTVDFAYPDKASREWALDSGALKIENNLPLGLEVWKDKLFVTIPRWKSGVPSTLNYVPVDGEETPLLKPYPSWEMNNVTGLTMESNMTKIVNVFRVRVDECDRLWVVDCGLDDIWNTATRLAPIKLMVFDLKTDKLIREFVLDSKDVKDSSFFANIIVDADADKCDEAYAYMPDLGSYALLVYSWKDNTAWRVEHHYFHFDPLWGDYNIGGVNFQWTDGIFGGALKKVDNGKTLYFHPLSSLHEFSIDTEILKDKSAAMNPENYHKFKLVGTKAPMWQATAASLDQKTGVMFFSLVNKNAVGCWNTNKPHSIETNDIVDSDNVTMVFPNDLILDKSENVWVLTDRLPVFLYRTLDTNDTNFRIMMSSVTNAIEGTACQQEPKGRSIETAEKKEEMMKVEMTTEGDVSMSTTAKPEESMTSTKMDKEIVLPEKIEMTSSTEPPVTMISMQTSTSSSVSKQTEKAS